jgi:hypothetical protein
MALVGYRYCVRNFLECLDRWKLIDQERSQKLYELSYMDAYAILISSHTHLTNLNQQIDGECSISPLSLSLCDISSQPFLLPMKRARVTLSEGVN